jgi:hypothetical protein
MPYGKLTARKFSHGNHLLAAIFALAQTWRSGATQHGEKPTRLLL